MQHKNLSDRLSSPGPKRILALDGGGIRGVLTLGYLERLESILRKRYQNPDLRLSDYFDFIGGTSTGSIIASGLAIGQSAAEIKQRYLEMGGLIFGRKKSMLNYLTKGERYDTRPLDAALKDQFGDITMGDPRIRTGLCVVTKRADTYSTWPIINHPGGKFYKENRDFPLWQVVRASAAAPTYFLPVGLKVGRREEGVFIDGGISMFNNPALQMLLIATLRGFPFHWPMGPDKLLLVSLGTGYNVMRHSTRELKNMNLLNWASMIPEQFISDANYFNQLILQILSDSPTAVKINSEVGDLKHDSLNGRHALSYLRYNVPLTQEFLEELGLEYSERKLKTLAAMDDHTNVAHLALIGDKAAAKQVKPAHLPTSFDINQSPAKERLRITQGKKWKLNFGDYVKKPVPVEAVQMEEEFEVETMEGLMRGKAGDYLIRGVEGEYYACDRRIFEKTYVVIK